ncbi:ankyrin repeat-containing domain protein [Bisporella sp. PMI_857]|nr:ankyrin repeat-containing domain protein [Bisporella sp. PMI_857]
MADPFSISVSVITLLHIFGEISGSLKGASEDYRHASEQLNHALLLRKIFESGPVQASNTSPIQLEEALAAARDSLSKISKSFPSIASSDTKKFRLWWAAKGKRKYHKSLSQLKEIESAFMFPIGLRLLEQLNQIDQAFKKINDQVQPYEHAEALQGRPISKIARRPMLSEKRQSSPLNALVHKFDNWLTNYFGIDAIFIVSKDDHKNVYSAYVKWHFSGSCILNGSFTSSWPTWPELAVRSKFRVQNIVPADSEIVKACSLADGIDVALLNKIKELFSSGKAHPNDTTPDNLTLLRFAVRGGNFELVKALLDYGADPELTFGIWETSPLDNAFYCGRPDIVRLLLSAKADLGYVNRRGWSPVTYMWDPLVSNIHTIELLDICAEKSFDLWESQDLLGWSPLHRAAAFGCDKDIKKLISIINRRASWNMVTLDLKWQPLQCAVRYGNLSTLNALTKSMVPNDWLELLDVRGWTPLHLAAQSGSEEMMSKLFEVGADPSILSDQSYISIPEGLQNQELTPQMIAKQYGYEHIYEKARKSC